MAVTWTCEIEAVDVANKLVRVTATRTDDTDPENVKTVTVSSESVDISTQEKKLAALDVLWAKYEAKVAKNDAIETVLAGLAASVVTNFTNREA